MPTVCDHCQGSSWIVVNGQAQPCSCRRTKVLEYRLKKAGLPDRYMSADFENFDTTNVTQSIMYAEIVAKGFVDDYPTQMERGIMFTGPCGVGKTHLVIAILRELTLRYAIDTHFTDVRLLLKAMQGSYNGKGAGEGELLTPILTGTVVALDELGAARTTDWSADVIEHIINTRYNSRLCTIITTNLPNHPPGFRPAAVMLAGGKGTSYAEAARTSTAVETLGDRVGMRMYSRLQEMCISVPVIGDDFRIRRA